MLNDTPIQKRELTCGNPLEVDQGKVAALGNEIDKPASLTQQQHVEVMKKIELQQSALKIGVTPERLQQMRDHAKYLRKKFPHMKPDRLKRKVAEYFKVKLV
jgi:hypothetical protein